MKLTRYKNETGTHFGFEKEGKLFSFADTVLAQSEQQLLKSIETYLTSLPESRIAAQKIADLVDISTGIAPEQVQFLPIIPNPTALIDFGLTPTHLYNSARGFIEKEFSGLKKIIAKRVIQKRVATAIRSSTYPYYKGNHGAISGEGSTVVWPSYSAYLDIEPELAFVYGNKQEEIAGYILYNDLSARDVQFPELQELSLTRSKDFDNGIGSFLVTIDEIPNYQAIEVEVQIGDRARFHGDCSDYLLSPQETLNYLKTIFTPLTGTVIGMGTIPGTCSIETGVWLEPGESFTIAFDHLGALTQHVPNEVVFPVNDRWKRKSRNSFYRLRYVDTVKLIYIIAVPVYFCSVIVHSQ